MAGEYRMPSVLERLDPQVAGMIRDGVRLALTGQPITGCVIRQDLSEVFAKAYEGLGDDTGKGYADKLRNGSVVPLVPLDLGGERYYAPGELFFRS